MESINPAAAQRVWQRVRGDAPDPNDALCQLLASESEIRAIYQYLLRDSFLRDSRLLSRLSDESKQFIHILSGISLTNGESAVLPAPPSIRGNPQGLLLQSFKTRCRCLEMLNRLPGTVSLCAPELKHRMEKHCLLLLELLGRLPRK